MSQNRLLGLGILVAGLLFLASQSFFVLAEQRTALVVRLGNVVNKPDEPGLYFRLPLVDQVSAYDARLRNLDPDPVTVQLADGSPVIVDYYVLYRIGDVERFFVTFGGFQAADNRLQSVSTTAVNAELGQAELGADILSDNRIQITERVAAQVEREVSGLGLQVEDLRISKVDLPQTVSDSIVQQMNAAFNATAEARIGAGREAAAIISGNTARQVAVISQQAEATRQRLEGEGDALKASIIDTAHAVDIEFFLFQERLNTFREVYRDDYRVLGDNGWLVATFRDLLGDVVSRAPATGQQELTLEQVFPDVTRLRQEAELLLADDGGVNIELPELPEALPVLEESDAPSEAPSSDSAPLDNAGNTGS
jgi:membrane protease subunit HflC